MKVQELKPNCCCAAPDGRKHVELKKTGINEVSLSGAWCNSLNVASYIIAFYWT